MLCLFFVPADETGVVQLQQHGVLLPPLLDLIRKVRAKVSVAAGLTPRIALPVADGQFHRTTSGKIQRGAFRRGLLDGVYATAVAAIDRALRPESALPDFFARPALLLKPLPPPPHPPSSSQPKGEAILIGSLGRALDEMCDALRAHGVACRVCAADGALNVAGGDLSAALTAASPSAALIHVSPWSTSSRTAACAGLLLLARCLAQFDASAAPATLAAAASARTLVCLTRDEGDRGGPLAADSLSAALAPSLCKALVAESKSLHRAVCVELPRSASAQTVARCVHGEMSFGCALDREVVYDDAGSARRVRGFASVGTALQEAAARGTAAETATPLIHDGGVYVVSGGLGGVGRGVVRLLLGEAPKSRLLILGRRPAAAAASALAEMGCANEPRVRYACVLLGRDYAATLHALRDFLHGSGRRDQIAAVLHLAGTYERTPLATLTSDALNEMLAAKANGAVHLHNAALELGQRPAFGALLRALPIRAATAIIEPTLSQL